jgi:hypothetical protein
VKEEVYQAVVTRSGETCEVEVELAGSFWGRCTAAATDVHHMLPKSRGGRILDGIGETCHLIHLCREHHAQAHSRKDADGLMIDGSVTWDKLRNRPVYKGTDPELMRRYPTPTAG